MGIVGPKRAPKTADPHLFWGGWIPACAGWSRKVSPNWLCHVSASLLAGEPAHWPSFATGSAFSIPAYAGSV